MAQCFAHCCTNVLNVARENSSLNELNLILRPSLGEFGRNILKTFWPATINHLNLLEEARNLRANSLCKIPYINAATRRERQGKARRTSQRRVIKSVLLTNFIA
jgi:hypothetical protein